MLTRWGLKGSGRQLGRWFLAKGADLRGRGPVRRRSRQGLGSAPTRARRGARRCFLQGMFEVGAHERAHNPYEDFLDNTRKPSYICFLDAVF